MNENLMKKEKQRKSTHIGISAILRLVYIGIEMPKSHYIFSHSIEHSCVCVETGTKHNG